MRLEAWKSSTHVPDLLQWSQRDESIKRLLGATITEEVVQHAMPERVAVVSDEGETMGVIGVNLYGNGVASIHPIPSPDFRKMKFVEDLVETAAAFAQELGAKTGVLVVSSEDRAIIEAARRKGFDHLPVVQLMRAL